MGHHYSNTVIGTLAVDGWAVTFGTVRRGLAEPQPAQPLFAVPTVTPIIYQLGQNRRKEDLLNALITHALRSETT